MALFDLPLDQLRGYEPALPEPDDLDGFWSGTLAATRRHPLDATFELVATPYTLVDTYDVSFRGYGGHPIRAWLRVPRDTRDIHPAVVQYQGYQSGRGTPTDAVGWTLAGYAHLSVDVRGQGVGGSWPGATADPEGGHGPELAGFMTRGIGSPQTYYYRRVYADAVRAVDAVRAFPGVDSSAVLVNGISQGGGIALAAASLVPDLAGALIDVPFLCDFPRAVTITDRHPYAELVAYLRQHRAEEATVMRTLSYVDGAILARRAAAPALFSVALMDAVCPPSTVFAAFNAYGGEDKEIAVYPYNGHEGGQADHEARKLAWAASHLAQEAHAVPQATS